MPTWHVVHVLPGPWNRQPCLLYVSTRQNDQSALVREAHEKSSRWSCELVHFDEVCSWEGHLVVLRGQGSF